MELSERKQSRLKEYNYSENGAYFITVCVNDRKNILWDKTSMKGNFSLSTLGIIVDGYIRKIPEIYMDIKVDKYTVMPNHIYMIITIARNAVSGGRPMDGPLFVWVLNFTAVRLTPHTHRTLNSLNPPLAALVCDSLRCQE